MLTVYFVCVALGSIGITAAVIFAMLNRLHNEGDTYGSFYNYSTSIDLQGSTLPLTRTNTTEEVFMMHFGKSPFENDNAKAPDMLKKNDDNIYGELEEVDIPLFKSNT